MKKKNLTRLIQIFNELSPRQFITILAPLLKMLTIATKVNKALGKSKFVDTVVNTLKDYHNHPDAVVRLNLLKIIQLVYKWSDNPKAIAGQKVLYQSIKKMAKGGDKAGILVTTTANELLSSFDQNLKL